jgi:Transcriptional regulator
VGSDDKEGALDRALNVLEALAEQGSSATLANLSASVALPKPTVHRILQSLVARGYARQVGEGRYAPGMKILGLAGQLQETLDQAELARPAMYLIQSLLPETVHFALLQGDHAVYVEKLDGRRAYRMASRIGMELELHCTAIGKSILAFLPDRDRRDLLADHGLSRRSANTITSVVELDEELARIRERGFAIDDEENEEQIRCVGAAVFDHWGHVIGGLSLSAPAFALSLAEAGNLGPAVASASSALSLSLGAHPDQLPAAYAAATRRNLMTTGAFV